MACRTETTTIKDSEYSVTQWPAEKAMVMQVRLIKYFGPALAKLATIKDTKGEINTVVISEALSILFESSSPEEITKLVKECITGVSRNEKRITESSFLELFGADDLMEMYQVFAFVVKVNYANFIPGQLVDNLLAKVKDQLPG